VESGRQFGLLGPLAVWVDGVELELEGGRQRAVLAVLLLRPNEPVPTERIVDELWGERPTATSVKAVHGYVSRLRKALGRDLIETHARGYVLRLEPGALDAQRFERLVERGTRLRAEGAYEDGGRVLRDALAIWRGAALADFADEPFASGETARLEELRLAALEERIDCDLELGRQAELAGELDGLVAGHPYRERLRGQLMLALYRSGRQAEALEAYRAASAALDELGLDPGRSLRELERQILTQDAGLDPPRQQPAPVPVSRGTLPGPLVPAPPFPFVGRGEELAALDAAIARAEAGQGGVFLLGGEPGGGKTRLIREVAQNAAGRGVLVCYGASDSTVNVPYQPVIEWLEFLVRSCDRGTLERCLGRTAGDLARLTPAVAELTGTPSSEQRDPESDRFALQRAVRETLGRLARVQPLLLVLDDLHWADGETLHLLRRLARTAPEGRVLLVGAFRDREEEYTSTFADALVDLGRLQGTERVTLGRLGIEEVGEFIHRSTGADAARGLTSAIGELTEGTPLLLCELWRDLVESGTLRVSDAIELTRPVAEVRAPERVQEVVLQRLSRLAPEIVAVLEVAAVAGPRFELSALAAGGTESAALTVHLEAAVRTGMIEELPEPAFAHRFTHELVRRAVYDRLTALRRAELHLRVGEALERGAVADPAHALPQLAHHFTLAAPVAGPERAVDYLLRAAEEALAAAALVDAISHYKTALALGIADLRERVRVQAELGWLLGEIGRIAEARETQAEAQDTATRLGDLGLATLAKVRRLHLGLVPELSLAEYHQFAADAVEVFTKLGDVRSLARAEQLLALSHRMRGRCAEARLILESALVHADRAGDRHSRRRCTQGIVGNLCAGPTPVAEAITRCRELLGASKGEEVREAFVLRGLGLLYAMAARPEEARDCLRRSDAVLNDIGHFTITYSRGGLAARASHLLGDPAAAERNLDVVWQWVEKGPEMRGRGVHPAYQLVLLYCDEGRWDEAERALPSDQPPVNTYSFLVLHGTAEARLAAHRGEVERALAAARRAVEVAETGDVTDLRAAAWLALADALRLDGLAGEADAAVASALDLYEQKGNVAASARVRWRTSGTLRLARTERETRPAA
jgi:DNA-binding SARP family transcriptional activator